MLIEKTEWFRNLKKFSHQIMIFGATDSAIITYQYIKEVGEDIECYIVSARRNNPYYLNGKPVKVFAEIDDRCKKIV